MAYSDIDSGKVLNKEGLLALCSQIKTEIANNSGGGASYTAGLGININSNDVITSYPYDISAPLLFILLGKNVQDIPGPNRTSLFNNATVQNFVDGIKAGKAVEVGANYTANGLGTALKDLGFTQVYKIADDGSVSLVNLTQSGQANWKPTRYKIYWACNKQIIEVSAPTTGFCGKGIINNLFYDNSTSQLSSSTIKGAIDELATCIPAAPTTDGTYTLQCVVSSGTPTYSWVAV